MRSPADCLPRRADCLENTRADCLPRRADCLGLSEKFRTFVNLATDHSCLTKSFPFHWNTQWAKPFPLAPSRSGTSTHPRDWDRYQIQICTGPAAPSMLKNARALLEPPCKMYILLHRSDFEISAKSRHSHRVIVILFAGMNSMNE